MSVQKNGSQAISATDVQKVHVSGLKMRPASKAARDVPICVV